MGRAPAEIAEGAEDYRDGGGSYIGAVFATALVGQQENSPKNNLDHSIGPTHSRGQVENATAPSAGGSPDGEVRLGKW